MTDTIGATVSFPGTAQSEQAMAALARAVAGLGTNVEGLTQRQRDQASVAQATAQAQSASAQQAIAFGQRIAGVANAVQGLVTQLGGQSRTAGLIGSIANTSVQFAQLGSALGPEGAVVGGIVGALIPALHELITSQDEATQSAHRLQEQTARLHEIQQETSARRRDQVQREIDSGHIVSLSLSEIHDQRELAHSDLEREGRTLDSLRERMAALERGGATETQRYHTLRDAVGETEQRIQSYVRTLGSLGSLEAQREAEAGRATTPGAVAPPTATTRPTRGHGGGRSQEQEDIAAALAGAYEREAAAEQQAYEQSIRHTQEENEAIYRQSDAFRDAAKTREDLSRREADQRARYQTQLAHYHEQERRWAEETARTREQQTQEAQSAATAVIGNLTNVFSLMAEGQMDAAHAAEMLLAGFLQYISQRATIEALAQVAAGIGAYPDFGGMALHFAAAAAWGAVAVATGVGGAALASDAQSKGQAAQAQADQRPASPQGHSDEGKGGGATYVINWNAPVVTAQTEAQLGRGVRRLVDRAAQRFPGG